MDIKQSMFFGVIGNFAGHLEQAKEASEFEIGEEPDAPKGIFPIYIPNESSFLGRFCVGEQLILDGEFVQIEPEIAICFDIIYNEHNQVTNLVPKQFAAFNDASKRIKAPKIAQKKNFSDCSKGLGNWIQFTSWKDLANFELCSYLKRDNQWFEYGRRESASKYCYFSDRLINFLITSLNEQKDHGHLEEIAPLITRAKHPQQAIICIGATPYTDYGDGNYLRSKDELFVCVAPNGSNCDYNSQPSDTVSCFIQSVR